MIPGEVKKPSSCEHLDFFFSIGLTVSHETTVILVAGARLSKIASLTFLIHLWEKVGSAEKPGLLGPSLSVCTLSAAPSPGGLSTQSNSIPRLLTYGSLFPKVQKQKLSSCLKV